ALVVAQQIVRDSAHPAPLIVGQRFSLIEPHEYLLRQILGEICITRQSMQVAEQRRELLIEQPAERLLETRRPFVSLVSRMNLHQRAKTVIVHLIEWSARLCIL